MNKEGKCTDGNISITAEVFIVGHRRHPSDRIFLQVKFKGSQQNHSSHHAPPAFFKDGIHKGNSRPSVSALTNARGNASRQSKYWKKKQTKRNWRDITI
jgi:hypothetical protein